MYTYNPNNNKTDDKSDASMNEEDIFLAGGYDSFSENNNNMHVGLPYMSGVDQYGMSRENLNRINAVRIPTFGEQFLGAFNPAGYNIYNPLSITDVKQFIKTFCNYYLIYVIILILAVLLTTGGYPISTVLSIPGLIILAIVFGICYFIFPLAFRLGAWVYRWIARLICVIAKKDLTQEQLYSVSVYTLIPYQVMVALIDSVGNFMTKSAMTEYISRVSLALYILPIIYMIIAILRMK